MKVVGRKKPTVERGVGTPLSQGEGLSSSTSRDHGSEKPGINEKDGGGWE